MFYFEHENYTGAPVMVFWQEKHLIKWLMNWIEYNLPKYLNEQSVEKPTTLRVGCTLLN